MKLGMKLEYELCGPSDCETARLLYKDIIYIHRMLVDEGLKRDDIEITFKTCCYSFSLKGDNISIQGNIDKKLNIKDRTFPKLEELIEIDDKVEELQINLNQNSNPYLHVLVTKSNYRHYYNAEAHFNNLDDVKAILKKIDREIKWGMIFNSPSIRNLVKI